MRRRWCLGIALLMPLAASSEGAVKTLDCTVERVCDASGHCRDATGETEFRMDPVELDAEGRGRYTISYDETEAEMNAQSEFGPFFWRVGSERHALIVSSESHWLWHQLSVDPDPVATIRFLACEFQG